MVDFKANFVQAADLIEKADALVITAGAGIGVDSGLPDFRGNEGFWKAYPALAQSGLSFTEVASPRTFHQDPTLAWGFYGHRLGLYRDTVPHEGFEILRKWGASKRLGSWVFTSNVDGQFQKAGFSEAQINECHGSIHHLQCMDSCMADVWDAGEFVPQVDTDKCRLLNAAPVCPYCGGMTRPNIVMFGDWNWLDTRNIPQRKRQEQWFDSVLHGLGSVVVIEMGAGTAIPSVRHFSQKISSQFGASIIRINPREFDVPMSTDVGIATGTLEALVGIDGLMAVHGIEAEK
jgi:NAD-dependent SIR2 family protein deacetylase